MKKYRPAGNERDSYLDTDCKKIEDKITVANERLQYLLSSTKAIIYSSKASGDFGATFISGNVDKITGFKPSDFLNSPSFWIDHVHPDDKNRILDDLSDIFKKKNLSYEYRFRRRDGSYIWMLDEVKLVEDRNGDPIEINGFWLDITDRKIAEEALKISEEKYRKLFNTMSQGVVYQDGTGKIISCNPAAERILGLTLDQMQGKTSFDSNWRAIHEDGTDFDGDNHPSMISLKSGKKVNNVIMGIFNPKNNYYTWINVNAVPQFRAGEKKPYQVYTTFEDITQIKHAEKALKKSEERYRLAQLAAEIGSWDSNIKTGELAWSDQIEPIFGFKKGKFGKTYDAFLDCVHPDDKKIVTGSITACIEKNIKQDIEHRIVWPDGSIHWVREIGDLIRDKHGKPFRMIGIVQDITERKKSQEKIKTLNQSLIHYTNRLKAANKEVEAFSYSVSHDLRAPLRSIDGFSQALVEDYSDKLDDTGLDYLNRVRNAAQHMSQLIDGMLVLSRLSSKKIQIENVDMAELAIGIINKYKKENPSRNVEFKVEAELIVKGDKNLIQILLENILGNAWKFTSKEQNTKITFGKTIKKNETIFFIEDNGAGFDMNYADKLFVPFQRLHDDEFQGYGIGLGIVSRIIRRHGGQIWGEGKKGKGAIFLFKLDGKKYD